MGVLAGERAVTDADRCVEGTAAEFGVAVEQPESEVEIAEQPVDLVEPGHQPRLGDAGVGGEHERAGMVGEFGQPGLDHVEPGTDVIPQPPTGVGQLAAVRRAHEQGGAEPTLQRPDLACHGRLAHAQLVSGGGEAAQSCRRLEHGEPLQPVDPADQRSHGGLAML